MTIQGTTLNNNWAALSGGALYATGFKFLNIIKQTSFTGNMALSFGADIDASVSNFNMMISYTTITNPSALNSIKLDSLNFFADNLIMRRQIISTMIYEAGGAINCQNCLSFNLVNS